MQKAIQVILFFLVALVTLEANAQPTKIKKLLVRVGCNLDEEVIPGEYEAIEASKIMQNVYDEIMRVHAGQKPSVQLVASSRAKNAFATEIEGVRYICYNEVFVQNFQAKSRTMWASRFLLAHEIGHHVLGHKFGGKTTEESHRDELEADAFAAKIMARLEADLQETLAGIETFDLDKAASSTHPSPDVRKQKITQAWQEEMTKYNTREVVSSNTTNSAPTKKFPLKLDPSSFKNPWNIISTASAEIDGEKVVIYFSLPPEYSYKKFRVCLKSNNASIQPGRNAGSLSGADPSKPIPYSSNIQVVWNYTMDRYNQGQAGLPENLRVYVYGEDKEPKKPGSGGKVLGNILLGGGVAGLIYGGIEMGSGLNLYNNTYKDSRSDTDYNKADDKFVKGQAIVGGGIVVGVIGAIILIKRSHKNKEYKKSVCLLDGQQWQIKPSFYASSQSVGLGIKLNF